jgi:hypothetical protein
MREWHIVLLFGYLSGWTSRWVYEKLKGALHVRRADKEHELARTLDKARGDKLPYP